MNGQAKAAVVHGVLVARDARYQVRVLGTVCDACSFYYLNPAIENTIIITIIQYKKALSSRQH